MASTYSTNLALELIATGEQSGTWGVTTNTNLGTLLEQAISGYVTQAITDGSGANTTITIPNGATGVARNMFIEMTGALTFSTTSLIVPANKKLYFIYNNTTGGFAVTVKVSGQTGVSVPNGKKVILVSNGTDIVNAENYIASLSVGALTSGRVPYAGTSGLLQDSANLTFNGTTLTANTIGAYTLSGTVAGGGNQINNVIIGTSTPLAGSFTSITGTSITDSGLTSGRVTFASTGGLLADSANFTYDGTTLRTVDITTTGNTILGDASTDTLNVGNGGLVKDASGNVGIGDTSPPAPGGTDARVISLKANKYPQYIYTATDAATDSKTWRTMARSSLVFQIQTTNDAFSSEQNAYEILRDSGANTINYHRWYSGSSEAMRLTSTGNLLLGTTTNVSDQKFRSVTSGDNYWAINTESNTWGWACVNRNSFGTAAYFTTSTSTYAGQISLNGATTSFTSASDYRLKENIVKISNALNKVMALNPVSFNFKQNGMKAEGFIAHELAEFCPQAVVGEKDETKEEQYEITPAIPAVLNKNGNVVTEAIPAVMGTRTVPVYQSVDTSFLVATLTAAIQELNARLTALESK